MSQTTNKKYDLIKCNEKYMSDFHIIHYPKDVNLFVRNVIESLFDIVRTNIPITNNWKILSLLHNSHRLFDNYIINLKFMRGGYVIDYYYNTSDGLFLLHEFRYLFKTSKESINITINAFEFKETHSFELIKASSSSHIPIPQEKAPDPPESNDSIKNSKLPKEKKISPFLKQKGDRA